MERNLDTTEKAVIKQQLASGKSCRSVARNTGRSKEAVRQIKHKYSDDIQSMQTRIADSLMELAENTLSSIDAEVIGKAGLKDRVLSASIAIDKSRLLTGQSTSNSLILHAAACFSSAESWGNGHIDGEVVEE
jgi:hypothetical protein